MGRGAGRVHRCARHDRLARSHAGSRHLAREACRSRRLPSAALHARGGRHPAQGSHGRVPPAARGHPAHRARLHHRRGWPAAAAAAGAHRGAVDAPAQLQAGGDRSPSVWSTTWAVAWTSATSAPATSRRHPAFRPSSSLESVGQRRPGPRRGHGRAAARRGRRARGVPVAALERGGVLAERPRVPWWCARRRATERRA